MRESYNIVASMPKDTNGIQHQVLLLQPKSPLSTAVLSIKNIDYMFMYDSHGILIRNAEKGLTLIDFINYM